MIIKKTKILKLINYKEINEKEQKFSAMIIIPHIELPLNLRSGETLKKILNQSLLKPKQILKKHEKSFLYYLKNNPFKQEYIIKRNFSLLVDGLIIKITDFKLCEIKYNEELEKEMIELYLNDYFKNLENIKIKSFYSNIIFNYEISNT